MTAGIGSNSGAPQLTVDQKKKLKASLDEINDSMTRKSAEADLIKTIVAKVSEDTLLSKKLIRRLAKTHFNRDFDLEVAENQDFQSLYEDIAGRSGE